jgi:kynurenine formamidase
VAFSDTSSLAATGAYVIALPMKITAGPGAPLRMVAFISEKGNTQKK